jgi:general secretion pathway protein D
MIVALSVIVFLSPAPAQAVRIAGEEQPVPTAPAPPPVPAAPKSGDRQEAPAKTETVQPAAGKAAAPAAVVPLPPARPAPASTPPAASAQKPAGQSPPSPSGEPPAEPSAAKTAEEPAPQSPPPPAPPSSTPAQGTRYVTIDFDNVDIQVFIKFVSELTGRNFLIDDKVKGKVTVISPKKIAVDDVYKVFQSVLEIYGFATVPAGDVIKVIPALEARGKNLELLLRPDSAAVEDKIVTQIVSLQHAGADDMKKVLDPLISKTSIILSYPPAGMLIITDVQSNIKRLQEIVAALDVDGVGEVISYIPLRSAYAAEIVKSLIAIFPPQRPGVTAIRIVADERTNSVILMASEQQTGHIKKLIGFMDKDIPRTGSSLNVYRLQNGNAEDMVKVLMNLPKEVSKDPKAPAQAAKTPVLSKDVNVVADKATNTLIITADRDDYKVLEGVIQKLDVPRPMVYIEALIMEVSVTKNFNVGVEWRGLKDIGAADMKNLGPNATALGMAGFTGSPIIPQVNAQGVPVIPGGLSLGVIGAAINIGGIAFPNIGAVIQAYKKDSDISILSTPQLLTLNNEDAEINVGKNVPYLTRSDTSVASPGQTFGQSFEYKDVGVILKITPNINEDQFVRLKIDQQVTSMADAGTSTTPTTFKRTAKTTVVIKDNETVVIGGMIDDQSSADTIGVPCLGDIPGLGWLFKTVGRSRGKTNLFVFITPHIVRNQAEAAAIYERKLSDVGNVEEGIIKMNEKKTLQKPQTDRKD